MKYNNNPEDNVTYMFKGEEINLREIRLKPLELSRRVFSKFYHFSEESIRNWELGLRKPPLHVLAYYKLIKDSPYRVYEILHGNPFPNKVQ